jgi:hypothetical protein
MIWGNDNYRWTNSDGYPFITIDQMHPASGVGTVRRWVSNVSGTGTLSGTLTGPVSQSTGTYFTIYVDGNVVYPQQLLTNSNVVPYNVPNISVHDKSIVDFVLKTNGEQSFDATGVTARITLNSAQPLNAPTNLTAQGESYDEILLNWTNNDASATQVEIQSSWGDQPFTTFETISPPPTWAKFTNAAPGRPYTFRVRALGANGATSPFSNTACGQTGSGLCTPSNLTAQAIGNSQIQLNWTNNATNATDVEIQSSWGDQPFTTFETVSPDTSGVIFPNAAPGRTYTFQVQAVGTGGATSGFSNQVSATSY